MKLSHLLAPPLLNAALSQTIADIEIEEITTDSRNVVQGALFLCVRGAKLDARSFIDDALSKGAAAVVCDHPFPAQYSGPQFILVQDIREAISYAASQWYGSPSSRLRCYGITGTSGKTSVAWMLSHALALLGERTFVGGTLGYMQLDPWQPVGIPAESNNTTMDPISVHRALKDAADAGVTTAVFEATSQGAVQKRMFDVAWDGLIYTNLSRDHLDLHTSMEEYERAKQLLFTRDISRSKKTAPWVVVNRDDAAATRAGDAFIAHCPHGVLTSFSASQPTTREGHFRIEDESSSPSGLSFTLRGVPPRSAGAEVTIRASSHLVGRHQIENVAAVAVALLNHGATTREIETVLPLLPSVPGRVEPVPGISRHVYIDYAHKPDALEKVLEFLKPIAKGKLICVFGCGGDRDKGKRAVMGEISTRLADFTVITSDNHRTETPEEIITQITAGVNQQNSSKYCVVSERAEAIRAALELSTSDDIVLIAGKGHEPYQEIMGVKYPFSDLTVTIQLASQLP